MAHAHSTSSRRSRKSATSATMSGYWTSGRTETTRLSKISARSIASWNAAKHTRVLDLPQPTLVGVRIQELRGGDVGGRRLTPEILGLGHDPVEERRRDLA